MDGNIENKIRTICRKSLSIAQELDPYWNVFSFYPEELEENELPRLALVHYNDKFDPLKAAHNPLRNVRGQVVDLLTGVVVADSYGYTEHLPAYSPITVGENGEIGFETEIQTFFGGSSQSNENAKHSVNRQSFKAEDVLFFPGNEGVIIRVFKHCGRVFYSTHKTLMAQNSSFGGKENNFYDMFCRLRGPEARDKNGALLAGSQLLFREDFAFSPHCYVFLVVDNKLRLSSSTTDNRVIFIGCRKMWEPSRYAAQSSDPYFCEGAVQSSDPYLSVGGDFNEPARIAHVPNPYSPNDFGVALQTPITIDLANAILFPDKFANQISGAPEEQRRLIYKYDAENTRVVGVDYIPTKHKTEPKFQGGDFVVMYVKTGGNVRVIHVESPAFLFRTSVTDNDPNFYHYFVFLADAFHKNNSNAMRATYPYYPLIDAIDGSKLDYGNSDDRIQWWQSILHESARIAARAEIAGFYTRYLKDIRDLADFILRNEKIEDEEEKKRLNAKTIGRFTELRGIATSSSKKAPNVALIELLRRETGGSVYKMLTSVQKVKVLREKRAEKAAKEAAKK